MVVDGDAGYSDGRAGLLAVIIPFRKKGGYD
jgi:hypothetical protein